jgi:putative nucleotidyltransferase with HDIG domain
MVGRPTPRVIAGELALLMAALLGAAALAPEADWDLPLLALLLGLSVVSDIRVVDTPARHVGISGSLLAIVAAVALLGTTPGVLIGVVSILGSWLFKRYQETDLLINLLVYASFPLLSGIVFHFGVDELGLSPEDVSFYLLVLGLFVLALAINFLSIAVYSVYLDNSRLLPHLRRSVVPVLPSELAAGLLTLAVTLAYHNLGVAAVVLFAAVLLTFQYLVGELILSQERSEELEVRAKQLAGFQVALLSALLRTLDLRDRMTARHSAAVARYSRELAARAGFDAEDQELVHSAGLLHDIGKFILPDEILRSRATLTEEDWEQVRRHPAEGARIVSQIDGYSPISDLILAHHERLDGTGYPRGLQGDEIPELARILSVADAYDAMTGSDTYRGEPKSSFEALAELRRVAGTQLDPRFVDLFAELLADKTLAYRHGQDVDFDTELALDKRIHDYVSQTSVAGDAGTPRGPRRASPPGVEGRRVS